MFWIMIIIGLVLDQLSKYWIMGHFVLGQSLPIIPNVFHLTYILNTGAAFSLLSEHTWLLTVISMLALAGIFWYERKVPKERKIKRFALACVAGGAVGNLLDRLYYEAVRDFLDFRIWPIFNIADCFVVVGVGLLIMELVREIREEAKTEKENQDENRNAIQK